MRAKTQKMHLFVMAVILDKTAGGRSAYAFHKADVLGMHATIHSYTNRAQAPYHALTQFTWAYLLAKSFFKLRFRKPIHPFFAHKNNGHPCGI